MTNWRVLAEGIGRFRWQDYEYPIDVLGIDELQVDRKGRTFFRYVSQTEDPDEAEAELLTALRATRFRQFDTMRICYFWKCDERWRLIPVEEYREWARKLVEGDNATATGPEPSAG